MSLQDDQSLRISQLIEALRPFAEAAASLRSDDADTMRPAIVRAAAYRAAAETLGLPYARFHRHT